MSVEAQTVEYSYVGDGISTTFLFPARFLSNADILVGVDGVQVTTGFSVEGAQNEDGGLVRFTTAPANGAKIQLVRLPPASQLLDFVNGQTVLESVLDGGLDKLTMLVQYLLRANRKTVRVGDFEVDPQANLELPAAAERKDRYLRFGALGEIDLAGQGPAFTVTRGESFPNRLAVTAASIDAGVTAILIEGYSLPGDGGGATYSRLAAAPVPVEPWHVQSADGAYWTLATAQPVPPMFGALGGPDDTAAFTALERYAPGRTVSLLGRAYNVPVKPDGCAYIEGVFITSGGPEFMPRHAKAHPFENALSVIIVYDEKTHIWSGFPSYNYATDRTFITWVHGKRHDVGSAASKVRGGFLANGIDIRDEVDVFSRSDRSPQAVQGGYVNGGRLLALTSAFVSGTATPTLHASYRDSDIAPFTQIDIAVPNQWSLGYGPMVPGANADTWHFFGYGSGQIIKVTTADNGLTYTSSIELSGYPNLVEPWVVRLDAQRWFMFLRDDAGGQAWVSRTSNGGASWSAPVLTGLPAGANPLSAIIEGGRLHLYVYARRGAEINGRADIEIVYSTPVEPLWTTNGVFPAKDRGYQVSASSKTNSLGYNNYARTPTGLVKLFSSGEDDTGSANAGASQLIVALTDMPTISAPAIIKSLRPAPSVARNSNLTLATRGTSFVGITTPTKWADGWAFDPNGGSMTITRVSVPANLSTLFPGNPKECWQFDSTASPAGFMSAYHKTDDRNLINQCANRKVSVQMWGIGSMPNPGDCLLSVDTDGAGVLFTPTAVFRSTAFAAGGWHLTAQLRGVDLDGIALGANPVMTLYLRFEGSAAWTGYLVCVKFEPGDPSPLDYGYMDTPEYNARFLERKSFAAGAYVGLGVGNGGANVEVDGLTFAPKRTSTPIITPSSQTALVVGGVGTTAIAAIDKTTFDRARLITTLGAGTLTLGRAALVDTATALDFLIDAELAA